MLDNVKLVLNNNSLMKRIGVTVAFLFLFVTLTYIPVPLLDVEHYQAAIADSSFGLFDAFSGGALKNFSVVALGISPYITASIVIQLLQMLEISPKLKELKESGEIGKQRINEITRKLALFLAFVQGWALIFGLGDYGNQLITGVEGSPLVYVYVGLVMTAGTGVVLWIADQITRKGIGNGSSMIIVTGIIMTLPTMYNSIYQQFFVGGGIADRITFFGLILMYLGIIVGVIFLQDSERRIPITHSAQGGKSQANIPVKLNTAGVMPVIFATTAMSVPLFVISVVPSWNTYSGVGEVIDMIFNYTNPIGFVLFIVLIYVFSLFYTFLMLAPDKVADNLKKQNAYVPGIRPGEETEQFITRVVYKITIVGAAYLAVLATLPIVISIIFNLDSSVTIGGTSLLIVVGVAIETTKQLTVSATSSTEQSGFLR